MGEVGKCEKNCFPIFIPDSQNHPQELLPPTPAFPVRGTFAIPFHFLFDITLQLEIIQLKTKK